MPADFTEALGGAEGVLFVDVGGNRWALASVEFGSQDVLYAPVSTSVADNTIVAADATKKIMMLACVLIGLGNGTARFEDGAGGTALTGQMNFSQNDSAVIAGANAPIIFPYNPAGWFKTSANTLLNLEIGGSGDVRGCIVYKLVA